MKFLQLLLALFFTVSFAAAVVEAAGAGDFGSDAWNWSPKWKRWGKPPRNPSPVRPGVARITILDSGRIVSKVHGNGKDFEYVPTIALIEDGSDKIIFDTGLPTDDGSLQRMINSLSKLRLSPSSINKVILSHAHLDHTGHSDTFKNAIIYHGNHMFNGYSLTYIGTYEFGGYNVTENVKIIPTPGHTTTCISALVSKAEMVLVPALMQASQEVLNNRPPPPPPTDDRRPPPPPPTSAGAQQLGIVAITGDLFFKVEDLTDDTIWKSSATDIVKQEESRKAVMCDVDYIIPGHGAMFKVPASAKTGCPN